MSVLNGPAVPALAGKDVGGVFATSFDPDWEPGAAGVDPEWEPGCRR
ncbi:hypothetical protein [Streptomyces sp. NPDC058953]